MHERQKLRNGCQTKAKLKSALRLRLRALNINSPQQNAVQASLFFAPFITDTFLEWIIYVKLENCTQKFQTRLNPF